MDLYGDRPTLINVLYKMFGNTVFERLTEITFGDEVVEARVYGDYQEKLCNGLFHQIGKNCPNLKVFDISLCHRVSPDMILMLLFYHPYGTLHQFAYYPPYKIDGNGLIYHDVGSGNVLKHETPMRTYCPWCPDAWTNNAFRRGRYHICSIYPIDDRLYDLIANDPSNNKHLSNIVKTSDLIRGMTTPFMWLRRPSDDYYGITLPPDTVVEREMDFSWYRPKTIEYHTEAPEGYDWDIMHPMTKTLRALKLNLDVVHHKQELVPFLLKALPNLKSLGMVSTVQGLRMIRDIPDLIGISAEGLEEVQYTYDPEGERVDKTWASSEIVHMVETFMRKDRPKQNQLSLDDWKVFVRKEIAEDIELLAGKCPNIRHLQFCVYNNVGFFQSEDSDFWRPLHQGLLEIQELDVHMSIWSQMSSLVAGFGPKLKRLVLHISEEPDSIRSNEEQHERSKIPRVDELFELCPKLEEFRGSMNNKVLDIYTDRSKPRLMNNLRVINYQNLVSFRAFKYLWICSKNLEKLHFMKVVARNYLPLTIEDWFDPEVFYFKSDDVKRLFQTNPMTELIEFDCEVYFANIEAANTFLSLLPASATRVEKLVIRVGLQDDHFDNHEEWLATLTLVLQSMKAFKDSVNKMEANKGLKIRYSWEKFGFLENMGDMGPLQELIEGVL